MIVVTFALREESRVLIRALRDAKMVSEAGVPERLALGAVRGWIGPREVLVVHTGVGEALTWERLQRVSALLADEPVECLITAGFAGGLDPQLPVGTVVLAENVSNREWLHFAAEALGGAAQVGSLITTQTACETVESKAELRQRTGGIAVDMETAATFAFCKGRGIPMLSLRVVSDSASDPLLVPFSVWFDAEKQRPKPVALVWYLALHPQRISGFTRFVSGVNLARRRLGDALFKALG